MSAGYLDNEFRRQATINRILREHGPVDRQFVLERLRVVSKLKGPMPHSLADKGLIVLERHEDWCERGMIGFKVFHAYDEEEREVATALRALMPSIVSSWGSGVSGLMCITGNRDLTFFALLDRA